MNNFYISFVLSLVFIGGVFFVVEGASPSDIKYPVKELGNCSSQKECKIFCDKPDNLEACVTFAQNRGMIKEQEAKKIKETKRIQKENPDELNGPGGCMTPKECDAFCRVESNLDECLNYSVKNGYTTQEEADRVRAQAKKGGPGGCKSKSECDSFCSNPKNSEECLSFIVNEGKITKEEAEFMKQQIIKRDQEKDQPKGPEKDMVNVDKKKVAEILTTQAGPGGCKNTEECNTYCSDFSHGEECMQFAVKNKIAPPEALEKMKKMSSIKSGPGGCVGPQECDAFCSKPENRQICFEFTKQNQLVSPEELERMEKEMAIVEKIERGETGPGGCKGQQECDAFCRNPEHIEECVNFAGQNGLLSPERVKDMMGKTQESFNKMKEIEIQRNPSNQNFFNEFRDVKMDQMPPINQQRMIPPADGTFPQNDYQKFEPQMDRQNFDPNMMPPRDGQNFDQMPQRYIEYKEGNNNPEGMIPVDPSGYRNFDPNMMPGSPENYNQVPPDGFIPPPDGFIPPPASFVPPPDSFIPPPDGTTGFVKPLDLLGLIINSLFRR